MAKQMKIAGLRTLVAGGPDRDGGGDGPLVCLLHGYGANADDLFGLWRVLDVPRGVRFAFPEAPLGLAPGYPAYAWWPIDLSRVEARMAGVDTGMDPWIDEEPVGLSGVRAQVTDWLTSLRAGLGGVPLSQVVLGGFSQGAMLATDVALHLPAGAGLAGLCLLSGAPVHRPEWRVRLADPTLPRAPRFQSHGTEDRILPFATGQALHDLLQEGGFPGELLRFRGAHEIPNGVLDALGQRLTGWLGGA